MKMTHKKAKNLTSAWAEYAIFFPLNCVISHQSRRRDCLVYLIKPKVKITS